jgi:PAS domain S-box-containing protein
MKLSTGQLIVGGYVVALVVLGIIATLAYRSTRQYVASVTERRQISDRLEGLAAYLSLLKDAETGQRGYLLTMKLEYRIPYDAAVITWQDELARLKELFADSSPADRSALEQIEKLSKDKMAELSQSVDLRAQKNPQAENALEELLASGVGREYMEKIRDAAREVDQRQRKAYNDADSRVRLTAGTTVWAVAILSPLAVLLVGASLVLVLRDLRHRTAAEAALDKQRALLSSILDSMNEGVVVADAEGKFMLFNPAAERFLGRGSVDADSTKWTEEYGVFEPDQVTPLVHDKLPLIRALRGETLEFTDLVIRPKGGAAARILAGTAGPMLDEIGRPRGGVIILRDVTHTRAAERRFQSLLESAPDALVIVDQRGEIRLANAQTERLFGYTRPQLFDQKIEMLVPQALRADHPQQRDAFFTNPHVRPMGSGLELYGQRANGSQFPIEISLSPVEGGEEPLVCAAIRDVTERRLAMDRIRQLNDELEDRVEQRTAELAVANEELSHRNQENEMFVYSVSHDLRSPLVNLQGFSQELDGACTRLRAMSARETTPPALREELQDIIDTDVAESIHFIRTSVLRLSGIIDALLRLSRAGRVVYQWQAVDTQVIVRRVLDAAHATITERQAEIIVDALPATSGDFTAIEQVFGNLITNALNYLAPDRPGRIEVGSLPSTGQHADFNTYYVRDNGLGIAQELQAKIFQAFQRLHPKQVAGEGIGLTLVQRIVERHGGRIWVESEPGVGSTFYFTLPCAAMHSGQPISVTASAGEHL